MVLPLSIYHWVYSVWRYSGVEVAQAKYRKHKPSMNQARALQLIAQFATKRLIVLGDLMLDEFIWG